MREELFGGFHQYIFFASYKMQQNIQKTENNIVWHHATVTRARREKLNGHHSVNLWFTGLSGNN